MLLFVCAEPPPHIPPVTHHSPVSHLSRQAPTESLLQRADQGQLARLVDDTEFLADRLQQLRLLELCL